MPNRLGLKFPNRNFGREQSAKPASPVLAPLPSLPVTSSPPVTSPPLVTSPLPPSTLQTAVDPAANDTTSKGPAERFSPVQVEDNDQAMQPVSAIIAASVSEPEPKHRLHSRFTEEHLMPLLPRERAEPNRALPSGPSPQPLAEPESALPSQPATRIQKQASTVGQLAVDPHMPLQGFRRHVSLRDPMVGIEQLAAIVASRQVRHEPAGPSDDDIMAVAQAAAVARRRASAERLNIVPDSTPVISQSATETAAQHLVPDAEADSPLAPSAEPDTEAAAADATETAYEDDFQVEPVAAADDVIEQPEASDRDADTEPALAKDVAGAATEAPAEAADSTADAQPTSGIAAQADGSPSDGQTEAVPQSDALLAAEVDGVIEQLNADTVGAAVAEQEQHVGKKATLHWNSHKT